MSSLYDIGKITISDGLKGEEIPISAQIVDIKNLEQNNKNILGKATFW